MCFTRTTFSREERFPETREGPVEKASDREHDAKRSRPSADRDRAQRDAEESREKIPVGAA